MPTLPKLPYTDNGTKTSVTAFTGISKIGDGALYDGLNMCSDYFPNIATRLGFARVGLKYGNNSTWSPDFECKAVAQLADGSGIFYIGDTKAVLHRLSDGGVEVINYGFAADSIRPESVVSFKRETTVGIIKYVFQIVIIASAAMAICRRERISDDPQYTGTQLYVVRLKGEWETTVSNPANAYRDISTIFGDVSADESWSPAISVHSRPVPVTEKQSVISASDDVFSALIAPGFYLSVATRDGDTKTTDTKTGLVTEVFHINKTAPLSSPVILHFTSYSGGDPYVSDVPFHSALFENDAGWEFESTSKASDSEKRYPTPPGRTTLESEDYKTYSVTRDFPENLRGAFISGNRMWAYDDSTIYASWLGQFELFTVDGTDGGGWSVTLPGTKLITGGIEYGGRPVFFTEDSIITVYGGYPSAFSTRMDDAWGVEYGSEQSLQLCAGSLYYLSKAGVMRYSGNVPVCISNDLTRYQLNNGRAGADGRHYYLYAENLARDNGNVTTEAYIYVWDVIRQSWHKWQYTGACGWNDSISAGGTLISNPIFTYVKYEPEDVSHVLFVNGTDKGVYAVPSYDRQRLIPGAIIRDGYFGYNDSRRWDIRLGRFYMNSTNMKILKGVHLRARLLSQPRCKPDGGQDRAARFYVRICYDDANAALDEYPIDVKTGFEEIHTENQPQSDAVAGEIYAERNIYIPIQNHRYESFWLDISGRERWEFSGLAFEYEASGRT